jgi:hypothetical protein
MAQNLVSYTYEKPKQENNQAAANIQPIALNYINPQGQTVQGYSINNKMYKDAGGTQRIDNGSIVTNQAGTQSWVMTDNGGVPTGEYYQNPANIGVDTSSPLYAAQEQAKAAANNRLQANLSLIEANRPKINAAYDSLAQQNYRAYMQGQEALANQLASQGLYNSGYSDSAKIAQNVGYQENYNANERARMQALADLETEINAARLNGSADLAELEAEYMMLLNDQRNYEREFAYGIAQDLMDRQYQSNRDAISDKRYDAEWQQALDEWAQEVEWKDEQILNDREKQAFTVAMSLAQNGDVSALKSLGYDTSHLETLLANELKQSNLSVQAAYADLAEKQKQAEEEADYNTLYNNNPKLFEDVMATAKAWVTNNANSTQSQFDERYKASYNVALKAYGQDYADLWAETVAQEWSAMMHPEPEPKNHTVTYNDAMKRVEEVLYSGEDGARTTNPNAISDLITELNDMDISNETLERILSAYGLWGAWDLMFPEND